MGARSAPIVEANLGGDVVIEAEEDIGGLSNVEPERTAGGQRGPHLDRLAEQQAQVVEGMTDRVVDSTAELADRRIARSPVLPWVQRRQVLAPEDSRVKWRHQWSPLLQELGHPLYSRVEAELKADKDVASARRCRFSKAVEAVQGVGDRLLEQDMTTGIEACLGGRHVRLVGLATTANVGDSLCNAWSRFA